MSKFILALSIALPILTASAFAHAADKTIKFNYPGNTDLRKVLEEYAKESGQKFMIDPQIRGQITIINPEPVTLTEAFNQLSSALAVNGIGYVEQDGIMILKQARNIQRDNIPTTTELPPLRPERMMTYIISMKHISAEEVNNQLRILTSKDGELVPFKQTNQIIVSDWTPNLHRIDRIVRQLDTAEAVARGKRKDLYPHQLRKRRVQNPRMISACLECEIGF